MSKKTAKKSSQNTKSQSVPKILSSLQFALIAAVALAGQGLAIYVSSVTARNFNATHHNLGCNVAKPNASGFVTISLLGLAITLFGLIKSFQQKNYLIRFYMIIVFIACLAMSFYAWVVIYLAGSCFF